MIERAKSGDPQANYELSLWAQERSEEEPDEPRWNRLAAKCLVKAAQAGYGPAQERMAVILQQSAAGKSGRAPAPQEPDMPEPVHINEARQSAGRQSARQQQTSTARRPVSTRRPPVREEPEDEYDDEEEDDDGWGDEDEDVRPIRRSRRSAEQKSDRRQSASLPFSQWGDSQWRKMEMICIGICALLLIAIAVIFITGRNSKSEGGTGSGVPAAGQVNTNNGGEGDTGGNGAVEPTALPEDYPDDDTLAAIRASDLEVLPADQEYVLLPTTATVSVGNTTLRLRYGPSTTYEQVVLDDGTKASMADGTKVEVFAKKGDWWMVRYEGKFGWCSKEYLIEDAEAASVG